VCLFLLQPTNETLFSVSEVYADPSHSSYEALRFVNGVSTTFTPKVSENPFFINAVMHIITSGLDGVFVKIWNFVIACRNSQFSCFHDTLGRSQDNTVIHGRLSTRLEALI
jgi:hypothetical protein